MRGVPVKTAQVEKLTRDAFAPFGEFAREAGSLLRDALISPERTRK